MSEESLHCHLLHWPVSLPWGLHCHYAMLTVPPSGFIMSCNQLQGIIICLVWMQSCAFTLVLVKWNYWWEEWGKDGVHQPEGNSDFLSYNDRSIPNHHSIILKTSQCMFDVQHSEYVVCGVYINSVISLIPDNLFLQKTSSYLKHLSISELKSTHCLGIPVKHA